MRKGVKKYIVTNKITNKITAYYYQPNNDKPIKCNITFYDKQDINKLEIELIITKQITK